MANKAVLGAAALGVGAYTATEQFKDWMARRERREREQDDRDAQERMMRRLEESLRREGTVGAAAAAAAAIGEDMVFEGLFQKRVYAQVSEILLDRVLKVGEAANPSRSGNLHQLDLPLLSNEYGREDLMLAAAFALGDEDVVQRVTQLFPKQRLGIGLATFARKAVLEAARALDAADGQDADMETVGLLVSLAIYRSEFRSGKPSLFCPKDAPSDFGQLSRLATNLGFHAVLMSSFRPSWKKRKVDFTFNSLDHRANTRSRRRLPPHERELVTITNFLCSFEAPLLVDGDYVKPDMERISLLGRKSKAAKPDVDAIVDLFANAIAAAMARVAAGRLRSLAARCGAAGGVSHGHIAVLSGYDGDLLETLESSDQAILCENTERIRATLGATLRRCIPPADGANEESLETEISNFVASYLKLIALSYCETPRLSGSPPSAFVPEYDVFNESLRGSCWVARPMLQHSVRRALVKEEREMVRRSRKLVVPGTAYSVAFAGSAYLLVSWLSHVATQIFLHRVMPFHSLACTAVLGQSLTLWTLHALNGVLKSVFELDESDSAWEVVKCSTEYIHRTAAVALGNQTPFETEMGRLRMLCKTQYRTWKLRVAKAEFYDALKRKRITNRQCVLLLTEFADSYVETEGSEVVKGVLPVSLSDAEQFLKLKVDEQEPITEVALSSSESVKNYLASESNEERTSLIDALGSINADVASLVQFSEGDRVVVNDNCEFEEESTVPNCSAIVSRRSRTGSVVFSTATLCFVHFDGEPAAAPIPVPISLCTILNEHTAESEKDSNSKPKPYDNIEYDGSTENSNEDEDEAHDKQAEKERAHHRARTVEEALVQGGWKLVRSKKHIKYRRRIKLDTAGGSKKQSVTLAKTSSDWRASLNALSLLRRLNESSEVDEGKAAPQSSDGSGSFRCCCVCHEVKPAGHFSKNQMKKRVMSKCKQCIMKQHEQERNDNN